MRRLIAAALSLLLLLSLAACGGSETPAESAAPVETPQAEAPASAGKPSPEQTEEPVEEAPQSSTLVVYFSRVGNTDFPDDIDAVSSATLSRKDGELKGNAQLMAEWMTDEAGGDLFEIQAEDPYPIDYRETTDVAKQEQNANARPALKSHIDNLDGYSTLYLVFPNWWGDLPMALYTLFDEYDFSGKTIYVSITHEGSGFSRTVSTIQRLEPDANVIEGISLRGASVPDSESTVRQFVQNNQLF